MMLLIRVLVACLTTSATWLVLLVVLTLLGIFIGWFQPSALMLSAAIGLSFGLLTLWPILFLRSGRFVRHLKPLTAEATADRQRQFEDLRDDLAKVGAGQGILQLDLLSQKLAGLTEVLKRRLNAGEITQLRYLDAAEQVYLSAIDNLHEIYVALTSVGTIDRDKIDQRLSELRKLGSRAPAAVSEMDSLNQRRSMLEQQTGKVELLFAQNEQVMTALDHAATALADVRITQGQASIGIDHALEELEQLANRAKHYVESH